MLARSASSLNVPLWKRFQCFCCSSEISAAPSRATLYFHPSLRPKANRLLLVSIEFTSCQHAARRLTSQTELSRQKMTKVFCRATEGEVLSVYTVEVYSIRLLNSCSMFMTWRLMLYSLDSWTACLIALLSNSLVLKRCPLNLFSCQVTSSGCSCLGDSAAFLKIGFLFFDTYKICPFKKTGNLLLYKTIYYYINMKSHMFSWWHSFM